MADTARLESNIRKMYLFRFFQNFQFWWPIWVLYLTDLRGFSFTQVAVIEGLFFVSMMVVQIPAGVFADRVGRKPVLVVGVLINAAVVFAFGTVDSFWPLFVTYLLWAWGMAIPMSADTALIYDTLRQLKREDEFQRVSGKYNAVFNLAILASLLTGAPLAAAIGLDVAIQISAIASLVAAGVALTLHEPDYKTGIFVSRSVIGFLKDTFAAARSSPGMPFLLGLYGFLTIGTMVTGVFFQPFLSGHGVALGDVGYLQAPARVMAVIGALTAVWFSARLGENRFLFAVAASMSAGFFVLGVWNSLGAFFMFLFINMGSAMALPVILDMLNRRIGSDQRATIMSAALISNALLASAFAPLLGTIADAHSLSVGFLIGGFVIAAGSGLLLAGFVLSSRHEAGVGGVREPKAAAGRPP
ncbi:MAG: MFS transporter [Dehalococcoidia bacterium]|nr:MFS transporter [Dehalococcoidia bacterium]